MALEPAAEYPGQVETGDPNYPLGKAQNVTVEGDGTGTPLEKALVNDLFGFQQALLAAASLEPTGVPDTALASQYKDAVGWIAASANATADPRHPAFGAVGNGTADDTTAVQDAFTALAVAGGTLDLGWATYRVTDTIVCPPNVNVRNGTIVLDSDDTDHFLSFTTASTGVVPAIWSQVTLSFADVNALMIYNPTGAVRVVFRACYLDCSTGAGAANLFYSTAASHFVFEDCEGELPVAGQGLLLTAGKIELVRGTYRTPLGFSNYAVSCAGGEVLLDHPTFDTSATTGGGAVCVYVGGSRVVADGCVFKDGGGNSNVAFFSDLAANIAVLVERGSAFGAIVPYEFTNYLALGSSVELVPHGLDSESTAAATVPASYKSFSQRFTNPSTTPPTITFDPPLFTGQQMAFMLGNDHTVGWTGNIILAGVSYDDAAAALANLGANSAVRFTAQLVSYRYEGGLSWLVTHMNQVVLI